MAWAQLLRLPNRQGLSRKHILLTKADKLTYGAGKNTLLRVQNELAAMTFPNR